MPVILSMQFDGGKEKFSAGLAKELDHLKSLRGLWTKIIQWFENKDSESPILEIFKTQGQAIGGSWENSAKYEKWKETHWAAARNFNVPITGKSRQILSGEQLNALLDSSADAAVRKTDDMSMTYGVETEYSKHWQDSRKILDFYPAMSSGMNRLLARFIQEVKELEIEGE